MLQIEREGGEGRDNFLQSLTHLKQGIIILLHNSYHKPPRPDAQKLHVNLHVVVMLVVVYLGCLW